MKNFILLLLCSSTLMAQEFNKDLEGKMVPAKMIFGDGVVHDIQVKYQAPEFFKNPQNKFTIKSDLQEDVYTHSGGIEAFTVDGNVWALRPNPTVKVGGFVGQEFVILTRQGAIETFTYIKYNREPGTDEENFVIVGSRIGTISRKVDTMGYVEGELTEEQLREWVSDAPEIVSELDAAVASAEEEQEKQNEPSSAQPAQKKKGLMGAMGKLSELNDKQIKAERATVDLGRIINNYNAWYESNSPGKIKYYFVDPPRSLVTPTKKLTLDEQKAQSQARLDDQYAGRSATVSPAYASAKDNYPEKKETFAAKLERIKNDGNKVGVLLELKPTAVPKPASAPGSTMMKEMMPSGELAVEGEYFDESLKSVAQAFSDELNAALGTTDFEVIDINNVPYKDMKMGRIDDWWASKYKVVFIYTVDPRLTVTQKDVNGAKKHAASLNMVTSLLAMEFIGPSDSPKQKVVAQVLNMGSFVTPEYVQDEEITDVKEIYLKIAEKLGMSMLEKVNKERADEVKKLVEKKLQ
ncbi:MAG: hypothetical protein RIB47_00275 [Cyclobacteriaceae bacterium]